ncbi:MAG: hypothetical protein Q9195_001873 [Heterodermia aff. obscurata]
MSAPQIPNLKTFRSPHGGRIQRRGLHVATEDEKATNDKIIQATDQDASVSRLSAVEVGYLHDTFAKAFVVSENDSWTRRFPIINRGTYVRTTAIDELVHRFLSAEPIVKKQIISLGAGSDTRFFRLQASGSDFSDSIVYHELDFAANTSTKISTIIQTKSINQCVPGPLEISSDGSKLHSPKYHIHPVDLRSPFPCEDPMNPRAKLIPLDHVDVTLPTLLISECCLIYLEPEAAETVLDYFASIFPSGTSLGFVLYEPINPFDSFGKMMVSNLAARGIVLQTLQKYHSLEIQKTRLRKHGFVGAAAEDVDFLWENWISANEKERVAALEMVDEVEEWRLLAQHYCVAWGWRGKEDGVWKAW